MSQKKVRGTGRGHLSAGGEEMLICYFSQRVRVYSRKYGIFLLLSYSHMLSNIVGSGVGAF